MSNRRLLLAAATALAVLVAAPSATSSPRDDNGTSLSELQRQREQVRNQKAAKAGDVNALEATDAEVTAALAALTDQVEAQQDRVEEAERALEQAEADRAAAEQAQAAAQTELDTLRADLKESAVDAYVNIGSSDPADGIDGGDVNEVVNKRTLLESQATGHQDLVERFRSVQEELEIQRATKAEAEQRATQQRDEVTARKAELDTAWEQHKVFADAVDERLNRALAEAASLAQLDSNLSAQITAKQAEIAKALAAQRAAEQARAAQRAAAQRSSLGPSGGGQDNSVPPTISGGGNIVSVGGIQISASVASNLQAMLAAAQADGIFLSGGGFRSPAGQIAVRRSNCGSSNYAIYHMPASSCRPPTAKPGSSMHEQGLAIDFTQGGSTLNRGSSGYHWLRANAANYGFFNLPSEPWHWSVNGR